MAKARAIVVTDGKRGHVNQSHVTARMLGDLNPLVMQLRDSVANGGFAEAMLRVRLSIFGLGSLPKPRATKLVQAFMQPEDNQAFRDFAHEVKADDLRLFVISTGTPAATFNLVLSRMLGAQSITNMTPSLLPRKFFSLNIVPSHDLGNLDSLPANVIASPLALGYFDPFPASSLASRLASEYSLETGTRFWGVAIGGPSKACPWAADIILDELAALHGLARGEGTRLLVTTSRRTPEWCRTWLETHYRQSDVVAYFLDALEDPLNPLPAFYELSEKMFVSGDSFSMVSEAINAGHLPLVLKVSPRLPKGKIGRALMGLEQARLAVIADNLDDLPQRVAMMQGSRMEPNSAYNEIETAVRYKLGLG